MTRWTPEKSDTLRALATEILHNYARGRVLVAVDGPDREEAVNFADELAVTIGDEGHGVSRGSVDDFVVSGVFDEGRLRSGLIDPFRSHEGDALMLVDAALSGHRELAGLWNYAVWVVRRAPADRDPEERSRATAVVDVSDPEHPRRLYDDAC